MSDARSNLQGKSMLRERLMWIAWPAFLVAAVPSRIDSGT